MTARSNRPKNNLDRNKYMTDTNNGAEFNREGDPAFPIDTENEDSTESPAENNDTDETPSPEGDDTTQDDPDKDKPFHEHPRWKEREDEWTKRFNDQESRHQDDVKKLREEFGGARKDNAEQTKIPNWFGGTQEQWDAYREDRDVELKAAEERAIGRLKSEKTQEDTRVQEATEYMKSEVSAIESDKTLNPDGSKIDVNKLLKTVIDNDLIDSKGRWNYKAGFRLMNASKAKVDTTTTTPEKKKLAAATTSENKPEAKPQTFKTTADFKKNRPW